MTDFKGFGTPPQEPRSTLIPIADDTKEEMDRAMRGYLRQGLSQQRALNCVAASVMFLAASKEGMVEGVDYTWTGNGAQMSDRMAQWVASFSPDAWKYLSMEGFITTVEPEPEPDASLAPMGLVRLALSNVQRIDDPGIDNAKAREACLDLLQAAGFDLPVAQTKLQQFLDGELPEQELLQQMEAGFEQLKNTPEEDAK